MIQKWGLPSKSNQKNFISLAKKMPYSTSLKSLMTWNEKISSLRLKAPV